MGLRRNHPALNRVPGRLPALYDARILYVPARQSQDESDAELIVAPVRAVDRLSSPVSRHERAVFRLARAITQTNEDAEDVLQRSVPLGVSGGRRLSRRRFGTNVAPVDHAARPVGASPTRERFDVGSGRCRRAITPGIEPSRDRRSATHSLAVYPACGEPQHPVLFAPRGRPGLPRHPQTAGIIRRRLE
jgi:hypothetical protein